MRILRIKSADKGFTILELMIATVVFSTILLVCTYGLIQIGNTYYKGAAIARTQAVARSIVDSIAYEIQYSTAEPVLTPIAPGSFKTGVCIGQTMFTATEDTKVSGGDHALQFTKSGTGTCGSASAGAKELLGENMRLTTFSVEKISSYYVIKVNVVYGDDDLINNSVTPKRCNGGPGTQFCASAYLETSVQRRKV